MSRHQHRHSSEPADEAHRAPAECPVCGKELAITSLGCHGCGTQLVGEFARCEFCALSDAELDLLRVFLASRGNLKEVEKHLGVSYPTARLRLTSLLVSLGLSGDSADDSPLTREQVLSEVASGALTPVEGERIIASLPS
ncbi:DUF2089 domain-containing protein [Propionibacteriaceae bacterium G1746]|uniref:DUF2089 domain-containing protein n=1 Tax=Aestuariimicrobium sp. G57 TaxID=3418485 RepID=UPI003C13DC42